MPNRTSTHYVNLYSAQSKILLKNFCFQNFQITWEKRKQLSKELKLLVSLSSSYNLDKTSGNILPVSNAQVVWSFALTIVFANK